MIELNISKIQNNIGSNPPKKNLNYINNINTIENKANNRNHKSKNFSKTQRIKGQNLNNFLDKKHIINEINTQQGKALKETIKPNHQKKNNNNQFRKSLRSKTISLMENPKEMNNIMPTEEEIINPYAIKSKILVN